MRSTKRTTVLLWTAQVLLALIFLFAGGMKLALPAAMLRGPVALPVAFLKFIGVMEVLGAVGLILPSLLRIRPGLTPLAAGGLVIIMIGATVVTLMGGMIAPAAIPAVVGSLAGFVAYGRWRVAPVRAASPRAELRLAA
jgi:DoxX-like protein